MKNAANALEHQANELVVKAKMFNKNPLRRQITQEEYENHDCKGERCKACLMWMNQTKEEVDIRKEVYGECEECGECNPNCTCNEWCDLCHYNTPNCTCDQQYEEDVDR